MSTAPVRVLHLIANFSVGGAENHLYHLVRGQLARGDVEVTVAYLRERPDDARSLAPDFQALGVDLVDLEMRSILDARAALRLRRLLRERSFDVVHSHLFRADLLGVPVAQAAGLPVVVSVHNVERHFVRPVPREVYKIVVRGADRFIAISDAVQRALIEMVRLPADRVERIYYGFPAGDAAIAPADLANSFGVKSSHVIVAVGRLVEQKGHRYLVDAMPRILKEFPDAVALIVGHDGGEGERLRALIRDRGLRDHVVLTGYRDDVREIMRAADVFAMPSLWEGFGLVLAEAMSVGLPAVASAVDSIPEVVVPGQTGLLVPPRDAEALAEAIASILRDPVLRAAMACASRERVASEFSVEAMTDRTVATYRSVMRR